MWIYTGAGYSFMSMLEHLKWSVYKTLDFLLYKDICDRQELWSWSWRVSRTLHCHWSQLDLKATGSILMWINLIYKNQIRPKTKNIIRHSILSILLIRLLHSQIKVSITKYRNSHTRHLSDALGFVYFSLLSAFPEMLLICKFSILHAHKKTPHFDKLKTKNIIEKIKFSCLSLEQNVKAAVVWICILVWVFNQESNLWNRSSK